MGCRLGVGGNVCPSVGPSVRPWEREREGERGGDWRGKKKVILDSNKKDDDEGDYDLDDRLR